MRARIVLGVNSGVVLALGLALLCPLALSLLYADGSWKSFLIPSAVMIPLGAAGLWSIRLRGVGYVLERDVYLSVTLAWVLAAILGGVPYLLEGTFQSLLDSTFEGMSGFTTTGATLLSDIEAETPSILFWRSMTQWLGGIGIVVLFVAVAPAIGAGAARLLGAEVSGLTETRFTVRIADTAKALLVITGALGGDGARPAPGRHAALRRGGARLHHRGHGRVQPQDRLHSLLRFPGRGHARGGEVMGGARVGHRLAPS